MILFCFSSSCVPYVAIFSGLSILMIPSVFSNFYFILITSITMHQMKLVRVRFVVFITTFNNISALTWCSVLLVEESRVPGENYLHYLHANSHTTNIMCKTNIQLYFIIRGVVLSYKGHSACECAFTLGDKPVMRQLCEYIITYSFIFTFYSVSLHIY